MLHLLYFTTFLLSRSLSAPSVSLSLSSQIHMCTHISEPLETLLFAPKFFSMCFQGQGYPLVQRQHSDQNREMNIDTGLLPIRRPFQIPSVFSSALHSERRAMFSVPGSSLHCVTLSLALSSGTVPGSVFVLRDLDML